ncbi:hypothetical protein ACC785_37640, partial [Rhizobium ruizarguesonis]
LKRNDQGVIRQGLSTFADLTVSATRTADVVAPTLAATIDIDPGLIYADGDPQELSRSISAPLKGIVVEPNRAFDRAISSVCLSKS